MTTSTPLEARSERPTDDGRAGTSRLHRPPVIETRLLCSSTSPPSFSSHVSFENGTSSTILEGDRIKDDRNVPELR